MKKLHQNKPRRTSQPDSLLCRCGHHYQTHRAGKYADGGRCRFPECGCQKFLRNAEPMAYEGPKYEAHQ